MSALALNETPPRTLASGDAAIDLDHLSRMTLGDLSLEREVLALFSRQAEILLERMPATDLGLAAASAHTMKRSARSIGAWRVADAAEAVEQAGASEIAAAIAALGVAVQDARAAAACRLRAH